MWRLWNKLFGWNYVRMNGSNRRVIDTPHGRCIEFCHYLLSLDTDMYARRVELNRSPYNTTYPYIPLTFKPEELIK